MLGVIFIGIVALIGSLFGLLGVGLVFGGLARFRRWYALRSGEPVSVREAATAEGQVILEGEIEPIDEPFESPLWGEECVACEFEIRRRSESVSSGSDRRWHTVATGGAGVRFALADSSGHRALVDPADARLELDTEDVPTNTAEEQLETTDDEQLSERFDVDPTELTTGNWYREGCLSPGDTAAALGVPDTEGMDVNELRLTDGGEAGGLFVSDAGIGDTQSRLVRSGSLYLGFGLFFAGAGFGIAASVIGPI